MNTKISNFTARTKCVKPKDVSYEVACLKYEVAKLRAEVLSQNIIIKKETKIVKEIEEKH